MELKQPSLEDLRQLGEGCEPPLGEFGPYHEGWVHEKCGSNVEEYNSKLIGFDFPNSTLCHKENDIAYNNMVTNIGKTLIKRHENELFTKFFLSIRPLSNGFEFREFVIEGLENFNIECLVPMFALCGENIQLLRKVYQTKQWIDKSRYNSSQQSKSNIQVTLAQIQTAEKLKKASKEKYQRYSIKKSELCEFLESVPMHLADRCVDMLIEHKMIPYHAKMAYQTQETYFVGEEEIYQTSEIAYMCQLSKTILQSVSVEMCEKFINYLHDEATEKLNQTNDQTSILICLTTLMSFFFESQGIFYEQAKKTNQPTQHQLEVKEILQKSICHALTCPDQQAFIRASVSDSGAELAKKACDWIGIDRPVYEEICHKELALWDKGPETYFMWQIGYDRKISSQLQKTSDSNFRDQLAQKACDWIGMNRLFSEKICRKELALL